MAQTLSVALCRHGAAIPAGGFAAALALVGRPAEIAEASPARRSKIWEFHSSLHCSIIGTCLSTAELRQTLGKLGVANAGHTDHELHATAVSLACQHSAAAKLLNKALDQRHRLAVSQFGKVRTEQEVRTLWREAVGRGEIPGAYWAALTHPASGAALIREAFGEVHMLSHLVGAANRADIKRLRALEVQQAELEARLARQQDAFRTAVVERDSRIRSLQQALVDRQPASPEPDGVETAPATLAAELERRLALEVSRRVAVEERLVRMRASLHEAQQAGIAWERTNRVLRDEIDAIDASLDAPSPPSAAFGFDGASVLYVGGRANQVAHFRVAAERHDAAFLHHDGGKEQHCDLLPGLIGRAALVFFPIDCISHDAALTIKRLCRQAGKRYVPLRSASVASFVVGLRGCRAVSEAAD